MTLTELGWRHFFQQQLSIDDLETLEPARVMAIERSILAMQSGAGLVSAELELRWQKLPHEERPTVGDWVLIDQSNSPHRLLERQSLFKRKAAGDRAEVQLIAANVDTLFVVSSCNLDFNLSRIERYLALALDAKVIPVLVLTKADLSDAADYLEQARNLRAGLEVVAVNSLSADSIAPLRKWCGEGQTVALVGSSGVGKSTLLNTMVGASVAITGAIREDDAKGRHTTTSRSLHPLPEGGLVLDSPGMRELKLTDVVAGLGEVFSDIDDLASACRFKDCEHQSEPGCAVTQAISDGLLESRRLQNYQKLLREDAHNTQSIAERHQKSRKFNKNARARNAFTNKRYLDD